MILPIDAQTILAFSRVATPRQRLVDIAEGWSSNPLNHNYPIDPNVDTNRSRRFDRIYPQGPARPAVGNLAITEIQDAADAGNTDGPPRCAETEVACVVGQVRSQATARPRSKIRIKSIPVTRRKRSFARSPG